LDNILAIEPAENLTEVLKTPNTNSCARVARRCGMEIRHQMGGPAVTLANRTVVTQRCAAWFKENVPDLRKCLLDQAVQTAVVVALAPSNAELDAAALIMSANNSDRQFVVNTTHVIPKYTGMIGRVMSWFGINTPSAPNF